MSDAYEEISKNTRPMFYYPKSGESVPQNSKPPEPVFRDGKTVLLWKSISPGDVLKMPVIIVPDSYPHNQVYFEIEIGDLKVNYIKKEKISNERN